MDCPLHRSLPLEVAALEFPLHRSPTLEVAKLEFFPAHTCLGLEPAISGSGGQRLIHQADSPMSALLV
eukprot:2709585-Amphidinium_carterae.1